MGRRHWRVPPKLVELVALIDQHGECIEYDLQHYHQTKLTKLWTGGLSWRRLGVLIRYLPAESATKTAIRNATPVDQLKLSASNATAYGAWSQNDMLLAELIDIARWLQWSKTKAADENRDQPKPYPRPGVARDERPALNARVINLLEHIRHNNGAIPEDYAGT